MLICEAGRHCGEEVSLDCWMFNRRSSGKLAFLQLRDGSGFIQGVVSKKEISPEPSIAPVTSISYQPF